MVEPVNEQGSNGHRILWMVVSALGIVMTMGAIAGYLAQHQSQGGGPIGTAGFMVMAVFGGIIVGLAYAIWRNAAALKREEDDLTRRERLNRNIMILCGLIGGLMGVAFALNSDPQMQNSGSFDIFSDESSLPVGFTIAFALVWGVFMPVVAWVWHRKAIDEQEAAAYRDGGFYAAYAFIIIAPVWWTLWRGGLLPEPHGIAIFLAFNMIWLFTWFWKKYR